LRAVPKRERGRKKLKVFPRPSPKARKAGPPASFIYGDCGNAFPTEIDLPLNLKLYASWNCTGAVEATTTDLNGNVTNHDYTDPNYWRLSEIEFPGSSANTETFTYNTAPWSITTTRAVDSSQSLSKTDYLDGLGRVYATNAIDPQSTNGFNHLTTTFDAIGRVSAVTNPYFTTSDPTYGSTSYTYDALNRTTILTRPDLKTVNFTYTGAATKVQDEGYNTGGTAHVTKVYQSDGLGRLVSVCEVSGTTQANLAAPSACSQDITATGFKTSYGYDTLNNIILVTQSAQTRVFQYDGLSRLVSEKDPEITAFTCNGGSFTLCNVYDTQRAGDLYTRTTPMPNHTSAATVTATYTHDLLHRITNISYNDTYTKPVALYWDVTTWLPGQQKGRLVRQDNAGAGGCGAPCAGEEYSYDIDGNIVEKVAWVPAGWPATKTSSYTYNYLDEQTSMTDIWGNVYTTSYDRVGRPWQLTSTVSDTNHPPTLYTVNSFNPFGEITSANYGNGVARSMVYDKRGRVTSISDGSSGSVYSLGLTYMPNGSVASANDSINGNWSSFLYDEFNRLIKSTCTANCPGGGNSEGYNYPYDQYGNRWHQDKFAGTGSTVDLTFDGGWPIFRFC